MGFSFEEKLFKIIYHRTQQIIMRNKFNVTKIIALISFGLLFGNLKLQAQADVATFLKAGLTDANLLVKAYITPFGNAFGAGINSGWFNTAESHKLAGFDLTVSITGIMAPSEARSFDFTSLNTGHLKLVNPASDPMSPTIFGGKVDGPDVGVVVANPLFGNNPGSGKDTMLTDFKLPMGTGFNFIALPNLQLRVGLVKNTDIIIRYIPSTKIPFRPSMSGIVDLWGIGIMHDIKQWIPGIKLLPFDLSVQAAYSRFNFNVGFPRALVPDSGAVYENGNSANDLTIYDNQGFDYTVTAYNLNAIISKKILILTVYGALGLDVSTSNIKIGGSFPVPVGMAGPGPNYGKEVIQDFVDPINVQTNYASARITLGVRFKTAIITIHGDVSYSKYPSANVGLGFCIR